MLKARDLAAYRDLLVLFTRYGRKDFRLSFAAEDIVAAEDADAPIEPDVERRAHAFAEALKKMGPTYIKFGQVLSTRPDIVPAEYVATLESLQDSVEPFSFADVERIVEEELGVRISKAFEAFESKPLAAAPPSARPTGPCCASAPKSWSRCSARTWPSRCARSSPPSATSPACSRSTPRS